MEKKMTPGFIDTLFFHTNLHYEDLEYLGDSAQLLTVSGYLL